ncbi:uncharacterized protein LOC113753405 isoform X2 [Coffea eugenioides]|uniref:uncharacterized protein LOC113753405 isoform X2 n=1 Tax=Coffea eugenioides TaxID=49369 RepID=UPI000F6053BE|nr:uncharacterized protein LOC113753405 isoform X2 [Coffea eugenioides]
MGSEGTKQTVTIHVTGFKKFQGVAENPTEFIVNNLRSYVEKRGLPAGVKLGSCLVLETAGDGALPMLYKVLESVVPVDGSLSDERVVWQAVNEATFRCPDELGWQPQQLVIVPGDGGITQTRKTSCSVDAILQYLKKKGHDVTISYDAGRFVCNYVYYHSLRFAEQKGHTSLFVHVPLFSKVDEGKQMQFTLALLEAIGSNC